jgi:hypothetical protein
MGFCMSYLRLFCTFGISSVISFFTVDLYGSNRFFAFGYSVFGLRLVFGAFERCFALCNIISVLLDVGFGHFSYFLLFYP